MPRHPARAGRSRAAMPGLAGLALALCASAAAPRPLPAPQDPLASARELETKRYALCMSASEETLADYGRLAEAAWQGFGDALGRRPKLRRGERVRVRLFADEDDWRAGMTHEQVFPPPFFRFAFYAPERETVFVYGAPDAYFTRQKLLEGLFLQFHYRCKAKNQALDQEWYVTGMADHFAVHDWDGETLVLGARRLLSRQNRASAALHRGLDARLVDGELSLEDLADVDVRWGLTAYLLEGEGGAYRKAFQKLALGLTGSMVRGADVLDNLGEPRAIVAAVDAWVRERGHLVTAVHGEWDERRGALIGRPGPRGTLAVALSEPTLERLGAVPAPGPGAACGLVLRWESADDCTLALADELRLRVVTIASGVQREIARFPLGKRPQALRAEREGANVRLRLGDESLALYAVGEPRLGLAVSGAEGRLAEVVWE